MTDLSIVDYYCGEFMCQQRAIETREKIFLATIEALAETGVEGVTHRVIAEKAGVSLASTTYHFATKSDLLLKTFDWMVDRFEKSYRIRLEDIDLETLDRPRLLEYMLDIYATERTVSAKSMVAWYEFAIEALRQPELQQSVKKWYQETILFYSTLFEHAAIDCPERAAGQYVDFLIGWDFFDLCRGREHADDGSFETLLERFFDGLQGGEAK